MKGDDGYPAARLQYRRHLCKHFFKGTHLVVNFYPQCLKNLGEILKAANLDFSNVAKCTIFLKDMNSFPVVNEIYGKYFPGNPPARETVEVSRLPKDVTVEISCIAIID